MKWFKKDPTARLQKAYEVKMREARDTQRAGNIQRYSALIEEADRLASQIEAVRRDNA